MKTLLQYVRRRHSMEGEEGIIEEIMRRLNIYKGWFVDVGARDTLSLSNTYFLMEHGWQGVEFEADSYWSFGLSNARRLFGVYTFLIKVPPDGLDVLLKQTPLPVDYDFLSIDIDSYDYELWFNHVAYRPKVVVIEAADVDAPLQPSYDFSNPDVKPMFKRFAALANSKGYSLVSALWGNLFFVDNALVGKLNLPPGEANSLDLYMNAEDNDIVKAAVKLQMESWRLLTGR